MLAQRRSAIRREPSTRPRREQSPFTSLSNIIQNRREMQQLHTRLHRDHIEADREIERLEAELQNLRRQRERTITRMRERTITRMQRHRAQLETDRPQLVEPSASSLDPTSANDPPRAFDEGHRSDSDATTSFLLPRPTRESNLRFEMAATSTSRPASPQRHIGNVPSPPHSLSDNGRTRPVDGPLDAWDTVPPLSQDFAPARLARAVIEEAETALTAAAESIRETSSEERPGLETPPPEAWESSYPPLRRVPHMSPRLLPRTPVDGLGDRRRSPSPISETHEEGTWNTLLSTLDHSNGAPSTSTSFASMSDFLSNSRSSSYQSSNTQNTSTSFGEIGSSSDETCDLPPGITEDDARMIRERHRRTARRAPRRHIPEPDHGNEGYSLDAELGGARRTGGTESAMSRLLMDQSAQQLWRDREDGAGLAPRLDAFNDILERMQRREHVPDDLWAVVGLPPEFLGRT